MAKVSRNAYNNGLRAGMNGVKPYNDTMNPYKFGNAMADWKRGYIKGYAYQKGVRP